MELSIVIARITSVIYLSAAAGAIINREQYRRVAEDMFKNAALTYLMGFTAAIPIFVSESGGMQATGDGPLDRAQWQRWIDWMDERQISWLTWSVADKNETCSMLLPRASSYGGWSEEDLKESGG